MTQSVILTCKMLPKVWYSNNQPCETTAESLRVRNLFDVDIHQSTVLYA